MMRTERFREEAFAYALKAGCSGAELVESGGEEFGVGVLQGEIDTYTVSRTRSLGLRVQLGGKNGYAGTEAPEDPKALVEAAMDNARAVQSGDAHPMAGPADYPAVPAPPDALKGMGAREKISLCRELERTALSLDPRVKRVASCRVVTSAGRVSLWNTLGLNAQREENLSCILVTPIMEANGEAHDGGAFRARGEALDVEGCAREAVEEAAMQFGGAPVPPGKYRILLRNDAAYSLLSAFSGMFSADAAQKGLSLLANREGEAVAAPCVTIVDDPLYPLNPTPFDDEGSPAQRKRVVSAGRLDTLLHNLKTAQKAGCATTGNGGRGGAGGPVGVRPSNFYIQPGEEALPAILQALGDGLFITELSGLHAGVNSVSGEFSLLCKGQLVQGGRLVRPVAYITLGGTFLGLLQAVERVGADLRFSLPAGSCFGSPSLLARELMVSGQ